MRETEWSVAEATTDRDHVDVQPVIAGPVPDLLETAECREIRDRVGENDAVLEGEPGRETRHVLLGYASIQKLAGHFLDVLIKDRESQVTGDQDDLRILLRHLEQPGDE